MSAVVQPLQPATDVLESDAAAAIEASCDLDNVRIPHVVIHVFRETEAFAQTWERAARDRRLVSATTSVHEGGMRAAIRKYSSEPTPDLIVVETAASEDILQHDTDALAEVCEPGTQLIMVGHRNDITLYQKLLGMGVANYMVYPVTVESVIAAISEVYRKPGAEKIGKIHAVIGARGGVGASTVAQNVARELAEGQGSDVLLVDMDLHFGSASLNLDVEPNQGLIEVIDQAERLDVAMLDRVLIKRGMHLNLLGTAPGLETDRDFDAASVERLLDIAGMHIPNTVLDIPHVWTDWVKLALTAADTVTIVSTPELGSLRNATTMVTQLAAMRPNDRAPHLVLNQVGMLRREEIGPQDVMSILKITPLATIPHDPRMFSRAASQGKLVSELGRRRPTSLAFGTIAEALNPSARTTADAGRRRRRRRG